MKSIIEQLKTLEKKQWDYYSAIGTRNLKNPFTQKITFQEFIGSYFQRAGKAKILDEDELDVNHLLRPAHTCSIFFLGILLFYKTDFHKSVLKGTNNPGYETFPFIWFLTSMYHDFGAAYEKKEKLANRTLGLDDIRTKFNIQHWLLNRSIHNISLPIFKLCPQYFLYRRNAMGSIDHGILAGILLFDRLVKNRTDRSNRNNHLYWGSDLDDQYAQAAAAVATHNIWLPQNAGDKPAYANYGLDYLLHFRPLTLQDFPLLYILGIVDTIDPVKIFTDHDPSLKEKYILSNLLISFKPLEMYIRNAPNSTLNFSLLTAKAVSLKGWMSVSIKTTKNTLRITFKEKANPFSNLVRKRLK